MKCKKIHYETTCILRRKYKKQIPSCTSATKKIADIQGDSLVKLSRPNRATDRGIKRSGEYMSKEALAAPATPKIGTET